MVQVTFVDAYGISWSQDVILLFTNVVGVIQEYSPRIGQLHPGPLNAITDVPGVRVGHGKYACSQRDVLAGQAQGDRARPLDYRSYMARFESDPPDFYRPEGPIPLRERLAAAWQAYRRPRDRR